MTKTEPNFELVAPLPAAAEKTLAADKKLLDAYHNGLQRGKAALISYAFLFGNKINQMKAADYLPHGFLEKFLTETYDLPDSTQKRWRELAQAGICKWLEVTQGKRPTVGLLKNPLGLAGKKSLSNKEQNAVLEMLPALMGRRGMVQFIEDVKLLREPEEVGGFKPSKEKLAQWLRANMLEKGVEAFLARSQKADLSEINFDDLPESLQTKFKKWLAALTITDKPNRNDERAAELLQNLNKEIVLANNNKWLMRAFANPDCADDCVAFLINLDKLHAAAHDFAKAANKRKS